MELFVWFIIQSMSGGNYLNPANRSGMKGSEAGLRIYRCLYWANQGLLQAVRSLDELHGNSATVELSDQLRRTQVMIEETRQLMNRSLEDWIKPKG